MRQGYCGKESRRWPSSSLCLCSCPQSCAKASMDENVCLMAGHQRVPRRPDPASGEARHDSTPWDSCPPFSGSNAMNSMVMVGPSGLEPGGKGLWVSLSCSLGITKRRALNAFPSPLSTDSPDRTYPECSTEVPVSGA